MSALAGWLGVPLGSTTDPSLEGAPVQVLGSYVKLGVVEDADGLGWERFKLFLGLGDERSELFFSVSDDGKQAVFREKWSRYRVPLLRLLSKKLGDGRQPATRQEVVTVDGGARFTVPADWLVGSPEAHVSASDAQDQCCLEVSCLPGPRLAAGLPPIAERLRLALAQSGYPGAAAVITARDRGDLDLVWSEFDYQSEDPKRPGAMHAARGRWLVAANDHVQALATFSYWIEDERWAVAEWQRIVDSLELAG